MRWSAAGIAEQTWLSGLCDGGQIRHEDGGGGADSGESLVGSASPGLQIGGRVHPWGSNAHGRGGVDAVAGLGGHDTGFGCGKCVGFRVGDAGVASGQEGTSLRR